MTRWIISLVATLLSVLPAHAGFAVMALTTDRGVHYSYIVQTSDVKPPETDKEQRYLFCAGPGYIAWAQGATRVGFSCGASSRKEAEGAALQSCPPDCTIRWTAYDDDQADLGRIEKAGDLPGYAKRGQ
jgi:hypothetical protein